MVWIAVLCVFLGACSSTLLAQGEVDLLQKAVALLEQGQGEDAQKLLEEVRLLLWNQLPLRVENVTLIEESAGGFGYFRPRNSRLYAQGEEILAYAEPKNYTILVEDGAYHIFLVLDAQLYGQERNLLFEQKEFLSFRYITLTPVFEVFFNLSFHLDEVPPGEYVLVVVVNDRLGGKNTTFEIPIMLR